MTPRSLLALAAATLCACTPVVGDAGGADPDDDGPPSVGTPEDTAPPGGATDGVEEIPDGRAEVVLEPPPGAFVGSVEVSLTSSTGDGALLACLAPPDHGCTLAPVSGPLTLTDSAVLHARVDREHVEGELVVGSYVAVAPELADFESDLPLLVAWTDSDADALWDNTPVGLTVIQPDGGRAALVGPAVDSARARLRIRGSSSSSLDKKNFDLELWEALGEEDRDEELLGLPADADWVLHAPSYFDDALIRNALGYQLSRDVGRYAPRGAFCEVFVGVRGQPVGPSGYLGVYVLFEEIERGADRVDVARLGPDDTAPPEVTGGYVFKRDRSGTESEELWVGDGDGAFRFYAPIVPVDPEISDLVDAQVAYLSDELDALGRALAGGGVDPVTGRSTDQLLDEGSFIDHHILNALFKNPDAFRLSGYFHKDREGLVQAGPLWDLDRTAGSIDSRARDADHWDATNFTSDTTPLFTYGWYGPLFDDPDFRARYWARWTELLAGPLSEAAILAHIDAMEAQLEEAGGRNTARWEIAPLSEEMDHLRAWFVARHAWITACIATHDDPRTCAG